MDKQQFSTKEEAAYPVDLAYAIAGVFAAIAVSKGWLPPAVQLSEGPTLQHLRAVTSTQPRASKLPPLVPEFKFIHHRKRPLQDPDPCLPGSSLQTSWQDLPPGAKYLRRTPIRTNGGDIADMADSAPQIDMAFGIYHTPEEFVEEAVKAGHPSQWSAVLPCALEEAIKWNLRSTPKHLCQTMLQTLSEWSTLAKDLQKEEQNIHAALPDHARVILQGKRILLWKTLLERYNYDDMEVVDELLKGVDLVGPVGQVPSMTSAFKPATKSVGELKEGAKASRDATLAGMRSGGDGEIDAEVYRKTLDEKADGWICGPIKQEDLPEHAVVNRRFGIRQGDTVRLYMYLFHVCFTGLHFVSWKPFWLQDLHLRFILGVYLKKNRNNIIQQAFTFPTCALVFLLVIVMSVFMTNFQTSCLTFILRYPSHISRLASGNAGSKPSAWTHRALRTFLPGFCSTSTSTSFHWHFVIFD